MHNAFSVPPVRVAHAGAYLWLLAVGTIVFWPIFGLRPLGGDNFYILAWADAASANQLLAVDPAIYPEWRPLAFQSIWLEHRMVPLGAVAVHHGINLLLWVSCCWLVYRIVAHLTAAPLVGVMAATFVLTDQRAHSALVWMVERQMTMACAFGLLAVLIVLKAGERRLAPAESIGVAFALFAAALSKEYGLSFAGALAGYAVWLRRADLAWPALASVAAYGALRVGIAGGAMAPYCEDMGFFHSLDPQCISLTSPDSIVQMSYNVAAAALGIPFQGIFNDAGQIDVDLIRFGSTVLLFGIAVFGIARGPRALVLIALVPAVNALLTFMLYRDRNFLPGISAVGILMGVGLAIRLARVKPERPSGAARLSLLFLLVAALGYQGLETRALVSREVAILLKDDPCESPVTEREIGKRFAPVVKSHYGMSNPACTEGR